MKYSCVFPLVILFINIFTVYKGAAHDFEDIKNHTASNKPFIAESTPSRIQPLHYAEDPIIPWDYENIFGNIWNTSAFKAYKYKDVEFRLMFPNGYDSVANDGKKYPLILHFAGRGEAGEDNELQLRHAGQGHKKAIEEDRFPGYALFPQIHNVDGFATDKDLKKIVEIIELLIRDNKVDANRIYVHGLSAGGESTWRLIRDYPYLFAAALPMSWSHIKFTSRDSIISRYIHIPIWISQGGKDDFPPPAQTNNAVSKIRDKGGNIRYKYLPNSGHGTWTAMYTAPDFFPFMLRHSKLSIHVYHGQTSFCPGEAIDVTLGISLGFDGYEWEKDEQPFAAGANKNEIQVTEAGAYRVRFRRGSDWTVWSESVMIDNNREVLPTLEISTNGKTRNLVTALDNSTSVTLTVPEGYEKYNWKRNNTAIPGDQTDSLLVSQAGSYTVGISEQGESALDENGVPRTERPEPPRCKSAFSAPVVVTVQDSPGTPAPPANFIVNTKTPFSLQIRWDDVANNELGYEIYRALQSDGPYTLVTITPPDATEYADENLSDQTTYFYKARAVNTKGGSTYTPEKSATTGTDINPPDAPASLTVTPVSASQIALTWNDKAFNEKGYKIFRSLSDSGPFDLIHTTAVNVASFTDTGLSGHTTYYYQIMAFNNNGESVKISSEGISTPNENPVITAIEPQTVKTGDTLSLTFTVTDPEGDPISLETIHAPNFASFNDKGDGTGSLKIMPASSQAGFYAVQITAKDDHEGSSTTSLLLTVINSELTEAVYINFGSSNAGGSPWNNTAPLPVLNQTYNTLTNANTGQTTLLQMKVRSGWNAEGVNGTTTQNNSGVYPDSVLAKGWQTSDSATLELSGLDPDLLYNFIFLGSKAGFDNGETTYYINGQKVVLDASRNVDNIVALNGIVPDAQGKVTISVVKSGASAKGYLNALVIESYENGVPIQPTDLQATPVSRTQIRLQWNDQAGNEEGYEIYRATGAEGAFSLLTTTDANVNSFTDGELVNNTIYKYRVRASNSLGSSDYSNEVSASTLNQRIQVNFNGSTHVMAEAPWNNTARTPTEGAVIPDLKDDQGNETNVDLVIENWGTGFDNQLGLTTGDNSGIYPDAVLKTYYFLEPYDEPVRLVFTGLDPQLSYNFTFFGDGGSGAVSDDLFLPGSDLRTQFIIGQDTVILNALDNTSKTVRINKVIPNEENAITVSIMAYEGATVETSAIFGIFNSIVVDGYNSENILMNNPPVITAVEDQSFEEGDTVSLQLQASDADGNPLAFSADNLPTGLNIDPVTGLISGVISEGSVANSPYAVEVTVNDSRPVNNLAKITFNIQITEIQIVCTIPTVLSAEPKIIGETAGALLSWTGDTSAPGYMLRYRKVNETAWEEMQTSGSTHITLKNLAFDTEYEWNVQGLCAENTVSDTSATQTFKTLTEPVDVCEIPQNVSTEVISSEGAPNTASVTWNAVSGITKYEIEYSADSINWTTLNSTETSVILTELAKDTDYHVLVRSVCAEDGSVISDNAYASFNSGNWETPVCGTPENISYAFISGESEPNAVAITWDAASTAMSYEIEYSVDSINWTPLNSTESSVTLTELSENTKYHVLVRSVCEENMISDHAYLTFNTGTFTEVCELPDNLTVVEQTPNDSTIDVSLTWQGPEGAAFYYILYAEKEAANWGKIKVTNDTTILKDLLPETEYRWAVITGCSPDETLVSDTSSIAGFTTDSIDVVSGIGDDLEKLSFKVYPVPSQGTFTVEFKPSYTEKIQMMVYNVLGTTMYQIEENTPEFKKEINLHAPNPGVYFVKLIVGDRVYSKRILIQQE